MRRFVLVAVALATACGHDAARPPAGQQHFALTSPAFTEGAAIPVRHTADGEDRSPPLRWGAPPAGTVELALVCHDPDAPRPGGWTHWVMAGIPPTRRSLPEGVDAGEHPRSVAGAVAGKNDSGQVGWGGPSPPPGSGVHHYHFFLYALGQASGVQPRASREELETAMRGHVLAKAELIGTYERRGAP